MKQHELPLSDYERDNLLWLLKLARNSPADTGDWCACLERKLENLGGDETNANWWYDHYPDLQIVEQSEEDDP